ncbi:hypothetical protein [Synechococcus sp. MIT S9503]|uniref:hypothetical protein n=1 Tax=Synechococcus sp. MIT S9503 TaxID=3082547 RepID=UPI0039A690D5
MQVNNWTAESGDGVRVGGRHPSDTKHTPQRTMTFSFYSKFNTSFTKKAPKFTNFSSKFTKGVTINKIKELEFDASKIHLDLNKKIQVGMTLDHGSVDTTEIKDKFDGYQENDRNSKLIGYVGKFDNGDKTEGCETGEIILGTVGRLAAGLAAKGPGDAVIMGNVGATGGVGFAGHLCEMGENIGDFVYDLFNDDEATTDTSEAEEDPSSTPASEPEKEPANEPQDDVSDEEPNQSLPEDDSDEEPNQSLPEDDSDDEPNQSLPEDGQGEDSSTQSNNPIDEGQGGNDEEAGSSFGDTDSDINWGPDGQAGGEDSSSNGSSDQLDPITNWGPDGKHSEAQSTMSLGIGILDPYTNWGDSQSDKYVISDFSGILGDIDPTHNDSDNDVSNLVESMTAVVSDFF